MLSGLSNAGKGGRGPNILWICADDFAPYVCGTYGDPIARTPNLDRLAGQGIRFDRSYCTCPLSTPSRMSFLTGRYPRSVGVTLSPTPLPQEEATIGKLLSQAGYETWAVGKTHYYKPLRSGFDCCIGLKEYTDWLDTQSGESIPPNVELLGPWLPWSDPVRVWLNADCLPYAVDHEMPDTFFTRAAARFLGEDRPGPFLLSVGFYVTHSPFRFPVEFRDRFSPAMFRPPPVGADDLARMPDVFRELTEEDKQGILAAYYTSTEYLDRNVGILLDALDRSGRADETLVIFHSDHGYMLGQHGRFEKHCCFEEAVRSALLMRLPGTIGAGQTTDALVELVDLVPTLLDLCGVEIPANVQGRSLMPLLSGATERHRDHVIAEYADNAEAMIRTERWKLIYSAGNRWRRDGYTTRDDRMTRSLRLYDLENDAEEMVDVSDRAENAALIKELLAGLVDHMRRTARDRAKLPDSTDPHVVLASCLPPWESKR